MTTQRQLDEHDGWPPRAMVDHACPRCRNGVTRLQLWEDAASLGALRWRCERCGYVPPQWWPTGRAVALIGKPQRISTLDYRSPRL